MLKSLLDIDLPQPLYNYAVRATEKAALACYEWVGKKDPMSADQAAVNGMRDAFESMPISGKIVIGEGERDKAPMLYIGEKVGEGELMLDIAVDPLEGTSICANGKDNSFSVLAFSQEGAMLHAPDVYMQKIVTGFDVPQDAIDLDFSVAKNLENIADAKSVNIEDLIVTVLERDRHKSIIEEILKKKAKVNLISDGDILASISCALEKGVNNVYMGIGGAPEGVLSAAALKCMGGRMQTRLLLPNPEQRERALSMGIEDFDKKYEIKDMVKGDVVFAATGVTNSSLLKGVSMVHGTYTTNSLVLRSNVAGMLRMEHHHTT